MKCQVRLWQVNIAINKTDITLEEKIQYLITVPKMSIRGQKAELGETSWFCIVNILGSISHCQQREKKRQMAHSERSSGWKICPFHFSPLTNWKVTATLSLQEQKGQFTPACGNPACSSLTCPCYSTSSLLTSPSSIWSNNRVLCDNYGKSQEEKSTVAG